MILYSRAMNIYVHTKHIPRYTLLSSKNVSRETRIARGKKSNNKHKKYSTAVGIQHVADACLLIFRFFIAQKKMNLNYPLPIHGKKLR